MSNHVHTTALNGASAPSFVTGPSPLGTRVTLALVLLCSALAVAAINFSLPAMAAVVLFMVVVAGCSALGARPFAVFALVLSVPFSLTHHFVYRPNIGAGDGLSVYLSDVWVIWLLVHYIATRQKGTLKPLRDFLGFLVPLTLLLAADLASFARSGDTQLSVYGIIEHFRAALLFVVLAFSLRQGKRELRAASLAIVCAVITIGGICVGEMILQINLGGNTFLEDFGHPIFRSAGLSTPTLAAGYLAALLPLVAIEYFFPLSRARKLLAGLGLILGIAGLGCTLTRAALGILAIGIIPLFVVLRRRRLIRRGHIIIGLLCIGLLGVGLADKMTSRLDDGRTATLDGRTGLIGTALKMASDSPLIGQGVNNYGFKMHGFIPDDQRQSFEYIVHSKFFLTLAETGLLGLTALVWLLVVAGRRALMLMRRGVPMGIGLLCSMIVVVLDMNFESYEAGAILVNAWILIALVAALWSSQEVEASSSAGEGY
jgi:hypothetical protein